MADGARHNGTNEAPDGCSRAEPLPALRLRLIGPDGSPFASSTPQRRRTWRLAEESYWRYDGATRTLDATPPLHDLLAPVANQNGADWRSIIHPDDLPRVQAEFVSLARSPGLDHALEFRVRAGDGTHRWMRVRATAEHDGDTCIGFAGYAADITDRRRSEEVIEQMVRQNALILDAAGEGICCIDARGRITFANPAAAELVGATVPDLLGRTLCRHMTSCGYDEGAEGSHAGTCPFFGAARGRRCTDSVERPDGTVLLEMIISQISAGAGAGGAVVVFKDVTAQRANERAMQESRQKMAQAEKLAALGTLISGVGHELRTPMSYINNHLYLIQKTAERMSAEDPDMEEIAQEFVRRSEASMRGIARMSALLDDLRESYKPEEAEFRPLDVRNVVEQAAHLFQGAYQGPVRLVTDLGATAEMPIQGGRIQQVVINLLNNAAEAMPEGGTISLRTRQDGDRAIIEVEDDGPGMPQDVQRSIFNPFYTTKRSGSGLGLYLVRQIVDRHLGRIDCVSTPGKGTRFRIELVPEAGGDVAATAAAATAGELPPHFGAPRQASTGFDSTPMPSTSSSTSSPGSR